MHTDTSDTLASHFLQMFMTMWDISPSTQPLNLDFPLLENGITIYLIAQVRNLAIILNYHPTLSYLHTLHLVTLESNCIAYMIIGVKLSSFPSLPAGII